MRACVYVCVHVCMYECGCMWARMCVCLSVCIYIYISIYKMLHYITVHKLEYQTTPCQTIPYHTTPCRTPSPLPIFAFHNCLDARQTLMTTTTQLLSQKKRKGMYGRGHHSPFPFSEEHGVCTGMVTSPSLSQI